MHLHGAVGWYTKPDGTVVLEASDQEYNPTLGIPAILPPDPDKDPLNDANVSLLWKEFRRAVGGASHVLVIGHSLNDVALVRELAQRRRDTKLAVAGLDPQLPPQLTGANTFELEFGPDPVLNDELRDWLASPPES